MGPEKNAKSRDSFRDTRNVSGKCPAIRGCAAVLKRRRFVLSGHLRWFRSAGGGVITASFFLTLPRLRRLHQFLDEKMIESHWDGKNRGYSVTPDVAKMLAEFSG